MMDLGDKGQSTKSLSSTPTAKPAPPSTQQPQTAPAANSSQNTTELSTPPPPGGVRHRSAASVGDAASAPSPRMAAKSGGLPTNDESPKIQIIPEKRKKPSPTKNLRKKVPRRKSQKKTANKKSSTKARRKKLPAAKSKKKKLTKTGPKTRNKHPIEKGTSPKRLIKPKATARLGPTNEQHHKNNVLKAIKAAPKVGNSKESNKRKSQKTAKKSDKTLSKKMAKAGDQGGTVPKRFQDDRVFRSKQIGKKGERPL